MIDLPTLYKKTSTGAIQQWHIEVEDTTLVTTFGQKDGKQQIARDTITEGKNIGRSNETTPRQQAESEARSQWEKKLKRGYTASLSDATAGKVDESVITGGINPMLAHTHAKQGHKITYPAVVQPKLDGHRCIAVIENGKATLWSRTRKPITGVPHIVKALEQMYDEDVILDGELYNHEYRNKFEELTSFIKREKPKEGHEVVQYHIYDVVMDKPFVERFPMCSIAVEDQLSPCIKVVPTKRVASEEELFDVFAEHLEQGYEGTMVRNANSPYVNKRSYDLQKVKEFEDGEFELTRIEPGRGKMSDKAVFICKTPEGSEFKCKLVGKLDDLKQYLQEPEKYVGKMVTVQYQNLSAYGVPRFGVALRFREDV